MSLSSQHYDTANYEARANESAADRLSSLGHDSTLTLDLVSAFAGDRPLNDAEKNRIENLQSTRGENFYPDILYSITHECFPPALAQSLWNEILEHKLEMSRAMGRNVRIAVAALDYLTNLKSELSSPTLIGESRVADIAQLALRDGLTRLFNHTTCLQKAAVEARIYERYGRPASLMMIDVDDFKQINDQYGHQAGDRALAALGEIIESATRSSDICCRYGGEEFTVILPSTRIEEATRLAERVREQVAQSQPDGRPMTVSIGVASCGSDTPTAQALVDKADAALYQAKHNGKNRVSIRVEATA